VACASGPQPGVATEQLPPEILKNMFSCYVQLVKIILPLRKYQVVATRLCINQESLVGVRFRQSPVCNVLE